MQKFSFTPTTYHLSNDGETTFCGTPVGDKSPIKATDEMTLCARCNRHQNHQPGVRTSIYMTSDHLGLLDEAFQLTGIDNSAQLHRLSLGLLVNAFKAAGDSGIAQVRVSGGGVEVVGA